MADVPLLKFSNIENVKVSADRRLVAYSLTDGNEFQADTDTVDDLLKTVGFWRTNMLPPIPENWALGERCRAFRDPKFEIQETPLSGDPLLHLRHEGFGWLHFVFTKDEARRLAAKLIAQADAPLPPVSGSA